MYELFLIGASVILALFTQKIQDMEMVKTHNVAILAYLLALTMGLCVPMYIIAVQLELSISVQYSVLAVWLEAIGYFCIICLFVPPLLPVLKEYGSTTAEGSTPSRNSLHWPLLRASSTAQRYSIASRGH